MYGAVTYNGVTYRVKTTVRVYSQDEQGSRLHNYDVTEVELLIPKTETPKSGSTQSRTNNSTDDELLAPKSVTSKTGISQTVTDNSITLANLLQDVEFSYESGKKISDELVNNSNYYSERVAQGDGEWSSVDGVSRGVADVATSLALDLLSNAGVEVRMASDSDVQLLEGLIRDAGVGEDVDFQLVWHGSPHTFDTFDHSKMGSGEGNQAFGWGTYVAENRQVAEHYAVAAVSGSRGNVYSVEIPDDGGSNYLRWEENISSDQADRWEGALYDAILSSDEEGMYADSVSQRELRQELRGLLAGADGNHAYGSVSSYLGSDEAASAFFAAQGIVGISYPSNMVKGGSMDGARSYVIFKEDNVKVTSRMEFMRRGNGEVYGWTMGGRVYLTDQGLNAETPIHEYTHLWCRAMMSRNADGWSSVKGLLRETSLWNEVANDPAYAGLLASEDALASEVLSRLSGRENGAQILSAAERAVYEAETTDAKAVAAQILHRLKDALQKFWSWVGVDLFGIQSFSSVDEVKGRVFYDLLKGTQLNEGKNPSTSVVDSSAMRENSGIAKKELFQQVIAAMKEKVADLFEKAKTGEFTGKPESIGRLSVEGKAYLEQLSGLQFKEEVDFVLNPSDLNHIRADHYGDNEKDKGNNIPLTDEDIQNMVEVIHSPDAILYGIDKKDGRKLFFFLKEAGEGLYNLTEVCSTKKGNLTAKSFYKTKKKGISQRVVEIENSLLPTSVTYSGESLSLGANIPTLFEISGFEDAKNANNDGLLMRGGEVALLGTALESRVTDLEAKLGEAVEVVSSSGLTGRAAKAKGWYDSKTGKVVVVLDNHKSVADVERTILHEVIGHKGLQEVVGKRIFKAFVADVFANGSSEVREGILRLSRNNGWDFAEATEEYIAQMAEAGFDGRESAGFWTRVKMALMDALSAMKISLGWNIGDRELAYMLWRGYQHRRGRSDGALGLVLDKWMQRKLGVGEYGEGYRFSDRYVQLNPKRDIRNNRGYTQREDGTFISRRADNAEQEGSFSAGPFRRKYNVSTKAFKALRKLGLIKNTEWHHTGKGFKKTDFYAWKDSVREDGDVVYDFEGRANHPENIVALGYEDDGIDGTNSFAEIYRRHKKEIEQWAKVYAESDWLYEHKYGSQKVSAKDLAYDAAKDHLDFTSIEEELAQRMATIKRNDAGLSSYERYEEYKAAEEWARQEKASMLESWADEHAHEYESLADAAHRDFESERTRNLETIGKERALMEISKIFGIDATSTIMLESSNNYLLHGSHVTSIGSTSYGSLFDQFRGKAQEAISFLMERNGGIAIGALHHPEVGDINLWWGNEHNGLQALITHHPELLDNLQGVLRSMTVVEKEDGYISLENETHQATLMTLFGYPNRNELFLTDFKKKLSDEEIRYRDGEISDDEIGVREVAKVREQLEARLATNAYQVREAFQDSMLSLKEFMLEALREEGRGVDHIKEVADFENAYVAENRLSSAAKAQWDEYEAKHIRPLLKAVTDLCGESKSARQELEDYMLAKHGLERQELMEKRDAASKALSKVGDRPIAPKQDIPNYEVLFAQWQLADAEWEEKYDRAYEMTLDKSMERDFAGLTGLTKTERVEDAKWLAQEIVSDYESRYGADIDALWIAVRGASRAQLEALRHGGVLTREEMEYIDGMYEYYIPMRGFRDGTSRDEYGYIGRDSAGNGTTMKGARGRNSVAGDPIATIAEMAERSFSEAGRNKMKQRFLNFIENHPSDLIGTSDLWLQYDAGIDEWRAVRYPERDGGESAEEYAGRVVAFVNSLETRSKTDKSLKRSDDVMEQPYRVLQGDLGEHQVLVKRGGKRVVITLYGNPRVAQAVNGLTNPDVPTQGSVSKVTNAFRSLMRYFSAVYTSYSPNFVLRNWQRDFIYASTILAVKEGVDYAKRFQANKGFVMDAAKVFGLLKKWENGELDESDAVDREFSLFMRNGGETGYIAHNDLEWHKNHVERLLKSLGQQNRLKGVLDVYERLNRSIECGTRFAVYLTSREMGRSVERSVFDAKESTVNFNKKGSGAKMMGMEGQTFIGNCAALVSEVHPIFRGGTMHRVYKV